MEEKTEEDKISRYEDRGGQISTTNFRVARWDELKIFPDGLFTSDRLNLITNLYLEATNDH